MSDTKQKEKSTSASDRSGFGSGDDAKRKGTSGQSSLSNSANETDREDDIEDDVDFDDEDVQESVDDDEENEDAGL